MIAVVYVHSVYDSLDTAFAIQFKTEISTVDERLADALAARRPVK